MPKLFWIGLALFVLGQVPPVFIIVAARLRLWPDPNPNPMAPACSPSSPSGPASR
jgi:hypothetical protein